jgi:chitodextrinase
VRVSSTSSTPVLRRFSNVMLFACLLVAGAAGLLINRPVAAHAQSNSTGLVAYYAFNEGSGTTVNDSSGNANTGSISGASWTTSGMYGSALSFNGKYSTVIIPDSATLHLSSGMTIEAWVYPAAPVTRWEDVIFKDTDIYFLEAGSPSGGTPAAGGTFTTHGDRTLAGTSALPANTWTHLAATYDGMTLVLYVNGVVASRLAVSDSLTTSTNPLQIGGDPAFGQYFQGNIDEVRVYNRALTQPQIQSDMTGAAQAIDTQAPTAPQNLSGAAISSTQINLTWTASTDNVGVTGYQVWRCQGTGCSNFVEVSAPTGTTYSDPGLAASTSYSYQVLASDAAGNPSGFSNIATVATTPAAAQQSRDFTAPAAPSGLSANPVSSTQINLAWKPSTDNVGVTGYQIDRCLGFGCRFFAQIGVATTASYSDTGLAANTLYSYRVRAVDAAGNLSSFSSTVNAKTLAASDTTPPTAPANLSATPVSSTQINLSWTASTDNVSVTGYQVWRCQTAGCTNFAQIATPTGNSFSDTGLTASTAYTYEVRATDAAGNLSSYSGVASAVTQTVTTPPPAGTIGFVQVNYATPQSSQASVSVTYSSAQVAGDLNVVVIGWNDTTATVKSVTDTAGNSYVLAVGPTQFSGALSQSIYYAKNIAAAAPKANALTVAFNGSASSADIRIIEYSGLDPANPLDVVAAASGKSSTSATPSATTTSPNDLLVGANIVVSMTTGPGKGFTQRVITAPDGDIAEDMTVTAAGNYTASASLNSAASWVMQMVAFRAAGSTTGSGGSGTVPPTPTLTSIAISPSSASVLQGSTQQFAATGTYSDGSTQSVTASALWTSSNTSVATIGASTGSATGVNSGTSQITASVGTVISPAVILTVTVPAGLPGGTAQLVQHVSSSNTRNNSFASPFCYHYQLPNLTTGGNAVVVGFTFNGNPTPTVKDDQGNAYTVQVNHYDSTDTQSIGIATAFNVVAGARAISVCFSSNPGGFVQPMATEFDNVVGVDGTGVGAQGSGTSVTAGSVTPSVTGDLAYQVVYSISTNQSSFTAGTQGNIAWNLLSADLMDGWAAQYGTYSSTAAINPTMAMGTSQKWLTAAILLKTGTTGGVPSGMRIVHLVHENLPVSTGAGGTNTPFPNPTSLQFPSSGNLLVAMFGGGLGCTVTGVTDSNRNAWSQAGATEIEASNDTVDSYYAGNAATSGNLRLTVNWADSGGDNTVLLYDVTGASTSPLDTTAGSAGSDQSVGNLTMPFTITPQSAGELIFTDVIWDFNTGNGLLGQFFDTNTFDGENENGPEPIDENNAWGHAITSSTARVSFTWIPMYNTFAMGNWAGMAVAFKPAP